MVLSGYADLQSIMNAINEGAIYQLLAKPWEDGLLRAHIEGAFSDKEFADENRRLQFELLAANANLMEDNTKLRKSLASKQ